MEEDYVPIIEGPPKDESQLNQLGYKQELKRGYGTSQLFFFSVSSVSITTSLALLFGYGLATGGPAVMVWSWIVGSFLTMIVVSCLAEICSTFPSAGSVYHWAAQLAREEDAALASYITGWLNFLGQVAGDCSIAYGLGSLAGAILGSSERSTTAFSMLLILCWSALCCLDAEHHSMFSLAGGVILVASPLVIATTVLASRSSFRSSDFVFLTTNNETGISSFFYVALIGMLMTSFSFTGYEGVAHMAEETKNAGRVVPLAMFGSVVLSAITGFLFLVAMLFCVDNIDAAIASGSSSTGALVSVFDASVGDQGAQWLTILLCVCLFVGGATSVMASTRLAFSLARDKALPFHEYLYYVREEQQAPTRAALFVACVECSVLMLSLVSQELLVAVVSLCTIGLQSSYLIPILLRVTVSDVDFSTSEFNLGAASRVLGWIAVAYLSFSNLLFCLPTRMPIAWRTLNWSPFIFCALALVAAIHWITTAKKTFVGPVRASNHRMR